MITLRKSPFLHFACFSTSLFPSFLSAFCVPSTVLGYGSATGTKSDRRVAPALTEPAVWEGGVDQATDNCRLEHDSVHRIGVGGCRWRRCLTGTDGIPRKPCEGWAARDLSCARILCGKGFLGGGNSTSEDPRVGNAQENTGESPFAGTKGWHPGGALGHCALGARSSLSG